MQRTYTFFVGCLLLLWSSNFVLANTEIVEGIVKPAVEMNFSQGLYKEAVKAIEIEAIIKKLVIEDLVTIEVMPLPKEPLEIVFPQVVIDDVIVYLHEKPTPTTFTIGDKQYRMNTPAYLLNQQSPG